MFIHSKLSLLIKIMIIIGFIIALGLTLRPVISLSSTQVHAKINTHRHKQEQRQADLQSHILAQRQIHIDTAKKGKPGRHSEQSKRQYDIANYTRVVRIGLLARNGRGLSEQGFVVRKNNMMSMVHNKVHNDTLFQVKIYQCSKYDDPGDLLDVKCDEIDLLLHTMKICLAPLKVCARTSHVLDLQDRPRPEPGSLRLMDGEVFSSQAALEAYCLMKFCLRLPFTFNLKKCHGYVDKERKAKSRLGKGKQVVGLVGNAREYGTLAESLGRANITFLRESKGKGDIHETCLFYSHITLAVAWSPFIVTNASVLSEFRSQIVNESGHVNQASIDYWHAEKPAERFTNPQWFDIPAIGYDQYASFRAYGTEFLCASDSCVLDLIARIERGEMDAAVVRVREMVKRDTAEEGNGLLLRKFLREVYEFREIKNQLNISAM